MGQRRGHGSAVWEFNGARWVPLEIAEELAQARDQARREVHALREELRRVSAPGADEVQAALAEAEQSLMAGAERVAAAEEALAEARAEGELNARALAQAKAQAAEAKAQAAAARKASAGNNVETWREHIRRLEADLANVRRRTQEEIEQARRAEKVAGLGRLAEVLDAVSQAVAASPDPDSPFHAGNVSLKAMVQTAIQRAGATAFGAVGEPFDPLLHEAIAVVPAGGAPGTVLDVVQVGLQLADGALVRPARVVVVAE